MSFEIMNSLKFIISVNLLNSKIFNVHVCFSFLHMKFNF